MTIEQIFYAEKVNKMETNELSIIVLVLQVFKIIFFIKKQKN